MTARIRAALLAAGVPRPAGPAGDQRGGLPDASGLGDRDADAAGGGRAGRGRAGRAGAGRASTPTIWCITAARRTSSTNTRPSARELSRDRLHDGESGLHRHAGGGRLQHPALERRGRLHARRLSLHRLHRAASSRNRATPSPTRPKIAGIPVGLPSDMPKAWFMALASLSKAATPTAHRPATRCPTASRAADPAEAAAMNEPRLVVGPFNRVEGDLEITAGPSPRAGWQRPMSTRRCIAGSSGCWRARDPRDALTITPRICGICSISQSAAAARALAEAMGLEPTPQGRGDGGADPCGRERGRPPDAFPPVLHARFRPPRLCRARLARAARWRGSPRWRARPSAAAIEARAELHAHPGPDGREMAAYAGDPARRRDPRPAAARQGADRAPPCAPSAAIWKRCCSARRWRTSRRWRPPAALLRWDRGDVGLFLEIAADLGLAAMGRGAGRYMSFGAYPLDEGHGFARGAVGGRAAAAGPGADRRRPQPFLDAGATAAHPVAGADRRRTRTCAPSYTWCKAPRLDGRHDGDRRAGAAGDRRASAGAGSGARRRRAGPGRGAAAGTGADAGR